MTSRGTTMLKEGAMLDIARTRRSRDGSPLANEMLRVGTNRMYCTKGDASADVCGGGAWTVSKVHESRRTLILS